MKIIQLIQKPQARGAEIFASQLSTALENLGHQVLLISLFEGDYVLPFSGKQIHFQLPLKNRLWDFLSWKKLGKIMRDFNPDLVQANGADTLKFGVFAKKLQPNSFKLIFNNGGVVSYYIHSSIKKKYNQFLFSQLDALVSVSSYSKKDLDNFISKPKPHEVIPIGIESKEDSILKEPTSFQVLVHIAGFTPEKNHQAVLRIFEKFLRKKSNSQLWLIGDGPLRKNIEALVRESSFSEKVRFFGAIPNPFSLIPSNSLVILPSKIEGLPAVILEAFQYQIPVFAYAVGGIPDLLIDQETGISIPANKEEEFGETLIAYLNLGKEEKNYMLQKAKELVRQNYQISQVAIQFDSYYRSLCESSS